MSGFPRQKVFRGPDFRVFGAPDYGIPRLFCVSHGGTRGQPGNVERLSMKHRLLIADRDAELCEFYRRFLADMGYDAETCTDGLDCLAKLRRATPAVLVLDLELLWVEATACLPAARESRAPGIPVLLTATAANPPDMADQRAASRRLPAEALHARWSVREDTLCGRQQGTKGAHQVRISLLATHGFSSNE